MERPIRILGIAGSLRSGSYNRQLLSAAQQLAPSGVEIVVFDALAELPHYDPDLDTADVADIVSRFRREVAEADGLLLVTPEYNGSVPGALKNAIDWLSRPRGEAALAGKPVSITGTSTGQYGGLWAQSDLKKIVGIAGARVVGAELPVPSAGSAFGDDGSLTDSVQRRRVTEQLTELAAEIRLTQEAPDALAV
jgi:chromate reductase